MMMKTGDVARELNVSRSTVHSWVSRGWIPYTVTPTGHRLFNHEDIEQFKQNYMRKHEGGIDNEV